MLVEVKGSIFYLCMACQHAFIYTVVLMLL